MPLHLAAAILTLASASPIESAPDCAQFLTGTWAGKGEVTEFGPPVKVDNTHVYNRNGSFITINRYLGQNKRWNEQKVSGKWTATSGRARGDCAVTLKSSGPGLTASSSFEITIVDKDRFRSFGVDMNRVRK